MWRACCQSHAAFLRKLREKKAVHCDEAFVGALRFAFAVLSCRIELCACRRNTDKHVLGFMASCPEDACPFLLRSCLCVSRIKKTYRPSSESSHLRRAFEQAMGLSKRLNCLARVEVTSCAATGPCTHAREILDAAHALPCECRKGSTVSPSSPARGCRMRLAERRVVGSSQAFHSGLSLNGAFRGYRQLQCQASGDSDSSVVRSSSLWCKLREQVLLKIGRCIRSQNDLDFKMAAKSFTLAAQPHKASVTTPTVCYPAQQVKLHCNQCSSVSPRFVWRLFGERESSDTCCKTSGLVEYPGLVVAGWAVHL